MLQHPSQASWTQFLKLPTDELWNNVSILVSEFVLGYVTAVIFARFFSGTIFVVFSVVSTRELFRECCPTPRAPDGWDAPRFLASCVASSWSRQNGIVSSSPPAGNAHRWALEKAK